MVVLDILYYSYYQWFTKIIKEGQITDFNTKLVIALDLTIYIIVVLDFFKLYKFADTVSDYFLFIFGIILGILYILYNADRRGKIIAKFDKKRNTLNYIFTAIISIAPYILIFVVKK